MYLARYILNNFTLNFSTDSSRNFSTRNFFRNDHRDPTTIFSEGSYIIFSRKFFNDFFRLFSVVNPLGKFLMDSSNEFILVLRCFSKIFSGISSGIRAGIRPKISSGLYPKSIRSSAKLWKSTRAV